MRVILADAQWDSGFITLPTDGGNLLMVNAVSENFLSGEGVLTPVDAVLVEIVYPDDSRKKCVSVIGMSDEYVSIGTDDETLLGHTLVPGNMASCWIDVDDREVS